MPYYLVGFLSLLFI